MKLPKYRRRKDGSKAFVERLGKRYYLPGRVDSPESLAAYHSFIEEILKAKKNKPLKPRGALLVAELVAAYLDHALLYYRSNGRTSTEYGLIKMAIGPMIDLHDEEYIVDYGPKMLKEARSAMVKNGWSRVSINKHVGRIRRMFKWAVESEMCGPEILASLEAVAPLRAGKTAAPERGPIKPVDPKTIEETLKWVNPVVASMIRLQQITGMRSANVCMMRPCEIDYTEDVWLYRPSRHKTLYRGKELIIALGPRSQEVIRPYIERSPEDFMFVPAEGVERPTRRHRRHYSPASYRRSIWYACQANDIMPWHPHQLRHNVGTEVRKVFGLEGSQAVLGHASLAASQIYAEKNIALAIAIAKQLG